MSTSASIPRLRHLTLWIGGSAAAAFLGLILWPFLAFGAVHSAPAPQPQAAFYYNPITSLRANPTITGTASSSLPLRFIVAEKNGAVAYSDPAMLIVGSRFAETVYPPITTAT